MYALCCVMSFLIAVQDISAQQDRQDQIEKLRDTFMQTKVRLEVKGTTVNTDLFSSFLSRELRDLHNITVVDEDADYEIRLTIMRVDLGHVVSIVISEPLDREWFDRFFIGKDEIDLADMGTLRLDTEHKKLARDRLNDLTRIIDDAPAFFPLRYEPDEIAKNLIATIDGEIFEPQRRANEDILERLKEMGRVKSKDER